MQSRACLGGMPQNRSPGHDGCSTRRPFAKLARCTGQFAHLAGRGQSNHAGVRGGRGRRPVPSRTRPGGVAHDTGYIIPV